MSDIILGKNQYGKAENRVVRIYRDTPRHEIHDLNVSTCLRGDFSAAHLTGDQADVLPTDTQKQTAYAYAKEKGLQSIEDYGLALARHFVHDVEPVEGARIEIEEYAWERAIVDGAEHDHTWIRKGQEVRTAAVTVDAQRRVGDRRPQRPHHPQVDGLGVRGLPEGRVHDPAADPRPRDGDVAGRPVAFHHHRCHWDATYEGVKTHLIKQFATLQSLALQQTL